MDGRLEEMLSSRTRNAGLAKVAYRQCMKILLVILLVAFLALGIVGILVKALLWLALVGLILFVLTCLYWWFHSKRSQSSDVATQ